MNIFAIAFRSGLLSLSVLFVTLMLSVALIQAGYVGKLGAVPLMMQVSGLVCVLVYLVSAVILWVDGVVYLCRGWRLRPWWGSWLLIFFLIFGHFVTAYALYWCRHHGKPLASTS